MTDSRSDQPSQLDVRALTPNQIFGRDFKKALWGGYATREVDAFLTRVGDAFVASIERARASDEQIAEQRAQVEAYQQSEDALRGALVAAQRFNEDIIAAAKREAAALVEEARLVKERALAEAAQIGRDVARDIEQLETQRTVFLTELRALLETHLNLLDRIEPARKPEPAAAPDVSSAGLFEGDPVP